MVSRVPGSGAGLGDPRFCQIQLPNERWPDGFGAKLVEEVLDGAGVQKYCEQKQVALFWIAQDLSVQGDESGDLLMSIFLSMGDKMFQFATREITLRDTSLAIQSRDHDQSTQDLIRLSRVNESLFHDVAWLHYREILTMQMMEMPQTMQMMEMPQTMQMMEMPQEIAPPANLVRVSDPFLSVQHSSIQLSVGWWPGDEPSDLLDQFIEGVTDPAMIVAFCFAMRQCGIVESTTVNDIGPPAFAKMGRPFNWDDTKVYVDQETAQRFRCLLEGQTAFDRSSLNAWNIQGVPELKRTNDLRIAYAYAVLFIEVNLLALAEEGDVFAYQLIDDGLLWPETTLKRLIEMPIAGAHRSDLYARLLILRKFRVGNEISDAERAIFRALENGPANEVFDLDIDTIFLPRECQGDFKRIVNSDRLQLLRAGLAAAVVEGCPFDEMVILQYWIHYIDAVADFPVVQVQDDNVFEELRPDGNTYPFSWDRAWHMDTSPEMIMETPPQTAIAGVAPAAQVEKTSANALEGINPIASVAAHVNFTATITFLAAIPEMRARWNEVSMCERIADEKQKKALIRLMHYALGPLEGKDPNRCNVATLLYVLKSEMTKLRTKEVPLEKMRPDELLVWLTKSSEVVVKNTKDFLRDETADIASSSNGYRALILHGMGYLDESFEGHTLGGFIYKKPSGKHVTMVMHQNEWVEFDPSGQKSREMNDWMFEDKKSPGVFHWQRIPAKTPGSGTAIEPTLKVKNDWRTDPTIAESAVLAYYRVMEE